MKNSIHIIILTLLLIFTAACGERLDERLAEVEAGMDANPDSVVTYLQSIKPESLINEYSRAQYGLMMARARSKNHEHLTDDTEICRSLSYFKKRNKKYEYEYMLCLFYKAHINVLSEQCDEAMYAVDQARKIAEKRVDTYWTARCYEIMADIFHSTYNHPEEIKMRKIAIDHFQKAGRMDNVLYALADLANGYASNREYQKSKHTLDSITPILYEYGDTELLCRMYGCYVYTLVNAHDYQRASAMADSLLKYRAKDNISSTEFSGLASIKLWTNQYDEVLVNIENAKERVTCSSDSIDIYAVMSEYYDKTGDLRKAIQMEDSMLIVNSHQIDYLLKQSGVAAQREILRAEVKEREWEARQREMMLWGLGIGVVMLAVMLCVSVFYYRERIRRKELEMSVCLEKLSAEYMDEVKHSQDLTVEMETMRTTLIEQMETMRTDMTGRMDLMNERETKMKREMARIFNGQWQKINRLSTAYINKKDTMVEKTLLKDLEEEIKELGKPASLRRIERVVDEVKDGLMSRFRKQCPELCTPTNESMVVLLYAQLSINAIEVILEIKRKTLYSRRTFLIKKIQALAPEDAEEFIAELKG